MRRYADKFMALSNKNKAGVTIAMVVGGFIVVFILTKLIGMLTKTLGKENSLQGSPSSLPSRVQPSMARTTRRRPRMMPIARPLRGDKVQPRRRPNPNRNPDPI